MSTLREQANEFVRAIQQRETAEAILSDVRERLTAAEASILALKKAVVAAEMDVRSKRANERYVGRQTAAAIQSNESNDKPPP